MAAEVDSSLHPDAKEIRDRIVEEVAVKVGSSES